jgi:aldose sugar dehydrogenase
MRLKYNRKESTMNRRKALAVLTSALSFSPVRSPPSHAAEVSLHKITDGLDHPWSIAFLPDGSALVSERTGQLRHLSMSGALSPPITGVPQVYAEGQGGLLDVMPDPDFAKNRMIYFSFAEPFEDGNCTSVGRGKLDENIRTLTDVKVIFRQNVIYNGTNHFGSRLVFDRSGMLFVTTGDRYYLRDEAQNPASHLGKVIRITPNGGAADGNPKLEGWAPEVWSIGHRNVQGAALHPDTGQLWTAEHGARGGDEINTPRPGKNYGWPVITYGRDYSGLKIGEGTTKAGMEQPLHYWDPSIAPAGIAFYTGDKYEGWRGNLFVCALAGQHVARLTLDGERVVAEEKLFQDFSRFRDIAQGPDGYLYVVTDNAAPDGGVYKLE